jgi:hypothetical protein
MKASRRLLALLALAAVSWAGAARAQPPKGHTTEALPDAAPKEVSETIRGALETKGIRVLGEDGKPHVDIWLRKSIPTVKPKEEQGVKYPALEEGTLLGVVRFHTKGSDFKGNEFPAGVYTVRYGMQPRDGDHLGVSESRDFVLLSPLKADTKLEPVPHKELVGLSVQVSGIKHPTVLYLVKPDAKEKPPRVYKDDAEKVILDVEAPSEEKGSAPVRLGIVVRGQAAE